MFPSFRDLFNAFVAKFRENRPDVDPNIKGSWSFAFGAGIASACYSLVIYGKELLKQFNPMTATGEFLNLHASYDNITRLGESPSIGRIKVYGINGTLVAANESWSGVTNGLTYTNSVSQNIAVQDYDRPPSLILNLTRSGSVATADFPFPHGFSAGEWVNISGADQSEYNSIFLIDTVPTLYSFTYNITGTPISPATGEISLVQVLSISDFIIAGGVVSVTVPSLNTGLISGQYVSFTASGLPFGNIQLLDDVIEVGSNTILSFATALPDQGTTVIVGTVQSIHANVTVQSTVNGVNTNLPANSELTYQGVTVGIFPIAIAAEGLQGGAEAESQESFRSRMLLARQAQRGIFTRDQIKLAALLINGNTNVYVKSPDSANLAEPDPILPGQVRVFILRKNDPISQIPNGTILELTKQSIILNGKLPAEMWTDDLEVRAPRLLPIDISINNISPDSSSMRTAIKSQLNAYFEDAEVFGVNLDNDVLRATVAQTKDLTASNPSMVFLKNFDWVTISETVEKDQLPILGDLYINGTLVV